MIVDRKTNILFITSDQQRADCYGFEGRRVRTPHLKNFRGYRFAGAVLLHNVAREHPSSLH